MADSAIALIACLGCNLPTRKCFQKKSFGLVCKNNDDVHGSLTKSNHLSNFLPNNKNLK